MGAGTTDFTLIRGRGALLDVPWGRGTLSLGCDEVDRILVAMFMDRAPRNAKPGAERAAWRRLKLRARKLKERLLQQGECSSTIQGKKIVVRLGDLQRDKAFRAFKSTLRSVFRDRAREALAAADKDGADIVDVISTGGGALMPFVLDAMKQARAGLANKERIVLHSPTPKWLMEYPFAKDMKFPQMAVAIGGAIATLLPSEAQF
jgi:molecular chaperone DnaK (HSP70)